METRKLTLTFYLDISTKTKDMMAAMADVEAMLAADDRFATDMQKAYINSVTTRGHEFMAVAQFKMLQTLTGPGRELILIWKLFVFWQPMIFSYQPALKRQWKINQNGKPAGLPFC